MYPQNVLKIFVVTPSLNLETIFPPCTELSWARLYTIAYIFFDLKLDITSSLSPVVQVEVLGLAVEKQAALMREEPARLTMKEW